MSCKEEGYIHVMQRVGDIYMSCKEEGYIPVSYTHLTLPTMAVV